MCPAMRDVYRKSGVIPPVTIETERRHYGNDHLLIWDLSPL
jgi:hypothetical protein